MHLIPMFSKARTNETLGMTVGDRLVLPTKTITSLGVVIDQCQSFRQDATKACGRAAKVTGMIATLAMRKGITIGTQHQLVVAMAIPILTCGSPI